MKSNRVIAFLCSAAIAVTSMSSLVVASAETKVDDSLLVTAEAVEKGYKLDFDTEKSTATEKYIDVYYVGYESVIAGAISIEVPAAVAEKITDVKIVPAGLDSVTLTPLDTIKSKNFLTGAYALSSAISPADGKLFTFQITLSEDITEDWPLVARDKSTIKDTTKEYFLSQGEFGVETDTVSEWVDPDATPIPVEKGYKLDFDANKSTATEKYIDIYYIGYESVIAGAISIEVPAAVAEKITDVKIVPAGLDSVTLTPLDTIKSKNFLTGAYALSSAISPADKKLFTFQITLSEDITEDWPLVARDKSTIKDTTKEYFLSQGEFGVETDTVTKWSSSTENPSTENPSTESPTSTPIVSDRKTPKPAEPTEEVTTSAPTQKPIEKGYKLVFDTEKSTTTDKYIDIYYVGYESVIAGAISVEVPTAVAEKITDVKIVPAGLDSVTLTPLDTIKSKNFLTGAYALSSAISPADKKLFTFQITLSEDITEDWPLVARDKSTIKDTTKEYFLSQGEFEVETDTVTKWTDKPVETDKPTDAPTAPPYTGNYEVAIKDIVTVDESKTLGGVYVSVTKNGSAAVYGTDYVAFLDDVQLTAEEFENVKNGLNKEGTDYVGNVKTDIIDKLVIKGLYGTTVAAGPAYLTDDGKLETPADSVVTKDFPTPTTPPTDKPTTKPTEKPTARPSRPGTSSGGNTTSGGKGGNTIAPGTSTGGTGGSTLVTGGTNFQDLGSVPWAVPAINALVSMGVLNGRTNTEFVPNDNVTRAEFAKMVCAAFGVAPLVNATQTFTDAPMGEWYYGYVEAAAAKGIVTGVTDTTFEPDSFITREQMAAMMHRAIIATGAALGSGRTVTFGDAGLISEYAVAPVNALAAAGVVNGDENGNFAPLATATRAEAACIVYQYFTSIAR